MAEACGGVKAKPEREPRRRVRMRTGLTEWRRKMARTLIAFLAFVLMGTGLAQARPQSPARSCAANRQSVLANGAVVLGTGGYTYDRFVFHRGFCQFD